MDGLNITMHDILNSAYHAFKCVYVHKLLHDNGMLAEYEPYELDEEMDYEACIYGLRCVSEAVWSYFSEYEQVETMYFSHPDMMEYYRLCRVYGKKKGVRLAVNPYMRTASVYVRRHLDQGCPACDYRLQTKINHKWASGIVFRMLPELEWHFELLTHICDIFSFYSEQLKKLKQELGMQDENQIKEAA